MIVMEPAEEEAHSQWKPVVMVLPPVMIVIAIVFVIVIHVL